MRASRYRPTTAAAVVVANMIGTGVFTSLGFQLVDIDSGFALMMLWVVGGLTALCGALTYAELGAALPRSGGEYNFVSRIYHPAAGFVSGWISLTIGFAAPTALAAMTFGAYLSSVWHAANATLAAVLLVAALGAVHSTSHRLSGDFQQIFTLIKVLTIVVFSAAALYMVPTLQPVSFMPAATDVAVLTGGAFAVSLIFVNYAYTGWNAAVYLTDEIEQPQKYLPRVLLTGTATVMALYLLLNLMFLLVAPMDDMRGQVEIGFIAAVAAFGDTGGRVAGLLLALLLISTVSAMMMAGPRVLQVIGQDFHVFRLLSQTNANRIPVIAVLCQTGLTLLFILTATFESILVFSGFTLALNTLLTVTGIYVLRWREPDRERPYRTWGYPITPAIYLALTLWTLVYILVQRPMEGIAGLLLIGVGLVVYGLSRLGQSNGERKDDSR